MLQLFHNQRPILPINNKKAPLRWTSQSHHLFGSEKTTSTTNTNPLPTTHPHLTPRRTGFFGSKKSTKTTTTQAPGEVFEPVYDLSDDFVAAKVRVWIAEASEQHADRALLAARKEVEEAREELKEVCGGSEACGDFSEAAGGFEQERGEVGS